MNHELANQIRNFTFSTPQVMSCMGYDRPAKGLPGSLALEGWIVPCAGCMVRIYTKGARPTLCCTNFIVPESQSTACLFHHFIKSEASQKNIFPLTCGMMVISAAYYFPEDLFNFCSYQQSGPCSERKAKSASTAAQRFHRCCFLPSRIAISSL